jgi:shikimate kinase
VKTNIALVGFMGTGKSTVGKKLAELLNKEYVEMDLLIEQKVGKSIPKIFAEDGEMRFRELELEMAKELSKRTNSVISTGGGVVLNKLNLDYLSTTSEIVVLMATPKEIIKRIMKDGPEKRPVIAKPDPLAEIKKVLEYRTPLYKNASKYIVNTTGKSVESIVREIIDILEGKRGIEPFLLQESLPERCTLCNSEVEEITDAFTDICVICKKESGTGQRCKEHHFICANCISQPSLSLIIDACLASNSINAVKIMSLLMQYVSPNRVTTGHNAVVAGSLLMAVYNILKSQGGKNKYGSLTPERIVVAMKKAALLPPNSGAFYGFSGPAAAVGIAVASFIDSTPKRTIERNEALLAGIHAQLNNLEAADQVGNSELVVQIHNKIRTSSEYMAQIKWPVDSVPACIKREVYTSLIAGISFFEQMYEVKIGSSEIKCGYSDAVPQCVKEKCVYFTEKDK